MYLLTDRTPALLPVPTGDNGLILDHSAPATVSLLDDLRSDRGMEWVPGKAWLTKVRIDAARRSSRSTSPSTRPGPAAVARRGRAGPALAATPDRRRDAGRCWRSGSRSASSASAGSCCSCGGTRRSRPADAVADRARRARDRRRRPGRLALVGGDRLSLGLAGIAAAWARPPGLDDRTVAIEIHYSHFSPSAVTVPLGVPVTFVLVNTTRSTTSGSSATPPSTSATGPARSPSTGRARPRSRSRPATGHHDRDVPGRLASQQYICHLPGHEAYGMVGTRVDHGS